VLVFPTRHLLLRDRRDWLGARSGLDLDRDGALTLARMPAPAGGKSIVVGTAYPYAREHSGIAAGPCDAVFVADTAHDRIVYVDGLCGSRATMGGSGEFDRPRGLAVTLDDLMVADSGNGRVSSLALPALEAHFSDASYLQPISLAVDGKGRVAGVDAQQKRVWRDDHGTPDAAFASAIVATGMLAAPFSIACGQGDGVLVSDIAANRVVAFDADGKFVRTLPLPAGALPGAIAADGQRTYVADAASGAILSFDAAGASIGAVPGYRGPVTALALDAKGNLYVKPALDDNYFRLLADSAYVASGTLSAGPYDAGERAQWERAWIESALPAATSCTIAVAQKDAPAPAPLPADWVEIATSDALLAQLATPGRYLWLAISLRTSDPAQSPRIEQVRAATPAENYLDDLPSTYARNDGTPGGPEGFLSRFLKLARGEQSALEEDVDAMPRIADPDFLVPEALPWLAQWLGFELPQIAGDDARRTLIERAVALLARRGTPQSIAEFVELHTGIRPTIVEAFAERAVWVLDQSSRLDFDTRLPALDPVGMVVPDDALPECCREAARTAVACPCHAADAATPPPACNTGPIGRAVVGESGPLAAWQIGVPLFSEDAYRFCVLVDGYRVRDSSMLQELRRIVEREKPAHTDYRVQILEPDMRVGFQSRVGIDAIVGGAPPGFTLAAEVGVTTRVDARDGAARVGQAALGDAPLVLT
jgi:phage tail-like protein